MKIAGIGLSVILVFAAGPSMAKQAQSAVTAQGIDEVEVMKATASVEKIDLQSRKVTLVLENGKKKTVKVDKDVQNLDQVKVGDRLKISYTEEIIILVGKTNETPAAGGAGAVGVAPKGAKPGVVMVDTLAINAKILAVNTQKHSVTLQDPDGKKQTIKVSQKIGDLSQLKVGESVDMVMTESLVVEIVK